MRKNDSGALTWAMITGGAVALCGIGVRFWWGAPYQAMAQMGIRELVPPVWLIGFLWTLWYFALGATLGAVLYCYGRRYIGAWRGGFFFLLSLCAGFLWYPLFFVRQNQLLSLLVLLCVIGLCAVCALCWQSFSVIAAAVMWLHLLWLGYLMILQLRCLFNV